MTNTDSNNSREWAEQAYALLKKRQEEKKQELIPSCNSLSNIFCDAFSNSASQLSNSSLQ